MSQTIEAAAELTLEQKRELLARALRKKAREPKKYPMSFAQRRLWFVDQYEPDSVAYNIPAGLRLIGPLDRDALERSFQQLIARHEALRTIFSHADSQPVQLVLPSQSINIPLFDLSAWPNAEQEAERLASAEAQLPFDLSQGPLLRAQLLKLSEDEHVLLLNMHHIVSDGWSMGILIAELSALYRAFSAGAEESPLEELKVQYADFSVWQRNWLQGAVLEEQLDYWREQLRGAPSVLELPTDYPRPAVQSYRGAHQHLMLSRELSAGLKALSQREGVTLFMTLLAAFKVLLWRYTGAEDVVVGTPIANRNRAETEELIGYFVNTLVLRTEVRGEEGFREVLKKVREVTLGAYAHQDVPFEMLVEELQPERTLSHSPLFQVMFVMQNARQGRAEFEGLKLDHFERESTTSKFDITLNLIETENGLAGAWQYSTDLFKADTIKRMAEHFGRLLEAVIANPEMKVSALPLLSGTERQQLIQDWSERKTAYPAHNCIHQLFEAQAERAPDAVSVVYEDERLSYRELNERANQLAHYLQGLGVGPEVRVGICMERSIQMVVSLLAVLKAGGAYVPLDPQYPQERLSFMLRDAEVKVVVSDSSQLEKVSEYEGRTVYLDTEWEAVSAQSGENQDTNVTADNLAYVIYTSGSSGQPKGALLTHHNVVRLFQATESSFEFNERDVWTLFHSYAFDFSVWELWGALIYGGRLVVVSHATSRSPEAFHQLLCEERVTVLNQTPSAFRQLMRAEAKTSSKLALRVVIFGGEALEVQSLSPWLARHAEGAPQLVNMYGITETTVHVTYRLLKKEDASEAHGSPIGRALGDLDFYVLDKRQQPVPIGVPGEVYVGGAGLARGYLHRPELTAERFIPHPFSAQPGARLYRTGDLARYLCDGEFEYLGRIDQQVKVRGHRIELGEIEAALGGHALVEEALVVARDDAESGSKRLVAYVVRGPERAPTTSELRGYLKERLPEYMVPAVFMVLDSLPLTPNKKVDRSALPAPDSNRPALDIGFAAPRTFEEQTLAEIWAEVLGLDRVGIHDNYFALGGDSIRSIQIRSLAQERGLKLTLKQLFQHSTVYELAQNLEREEADLVTDHQPFSLISDEDRQKMPDDVEDAYPLSMLQAGMIFHTEYNPDSATYHNVSFIHLQTPYHHDRFQRAISQLLSRHAVLRTSFALRSFSEPLQLVHRTVEAPLEVSDLRDLSTFEQEHVLSAWFEDEKYRKFDWALAPLLRFHVHRLSDEVFRLTLTEHHSILDGWSVAAMLSELFQLYFSASEETAEARPLQTSFKSYVASELKALASEEQRHFWTQNLSGSTATILPRWQAPQQVATAPQVHKHNELLSVELSEKIRSLSQSLRVPVKSVLLAAHLKVLSLLSGQRDVMTGLVSNGRLEEKDGEQVLGLFLNTLPFRQHLSNGTWLDLVRETFSTESQMIPFRSYPIAKIQRVMGGQSLFEAVFNFVHFHVFDDVLQLEEMQVLGGDSHIQTSYPFVTNFGLAPGAAYQLHLSIHYNQIDFCDAQIEAIAGYYVRALDMMVCNPTARHTRQSLLSETERRQLLQTWNETKKERSTQQCVHELFEAQVEVSPDATAVIYEDQQFSYRELNERANQLAHYLQGLGVGPEVRVGICMERSIQMVISLLAVLKAGGAYVPLDPQYPQERLSFMLRDAEVEVVLTHSSLAEKVSQQAGQIICLDTEWAAIAQHRDSNPVSEVKSDNLVYVVYTSGSTGQPKAASMPHRALLNLILWHSSQFDSANHAVVLQFSSLSFDVSFQEMFSTWHSGSTLLLVSEEVRRDAEALLGVVASRSVSRIFMPFVALQQLAEVAVGRKREALALREVITAGEQLRITPELEELFGRLEQCTLHNHYGPSETHVVTAYTLAGDATEWAKLPPIGRPISNVEMYVLDEEQEAVPVGVLGELYIGGEGVGRGYLNRPEVTAERFVPHPYSETPGARLYKTGDVARYRADGNIEYIGRRDEQVKVRGYRIELGEIEAVLSEHSSVTEVVVIAREDVEGHGKRIVAYVVSDVEPGGLSVELRRYLQEKLPEYMVPALFVKLDKLPLTPSGKVDRRSLPAPVIASHREKRFVAPSTPVEEVLAGIWSEVLGVGQISTDDNFIELGGHSLLATQIVSRVRAVFQVELPLRVMLESPTIGDLAGAVLRHLDDEETANETASLLLSIAQMSEAEVERMLSEQVA